MGKGPPKPLGCGQCRASPSASQSLLLIFVGLQEEQENPSGFSLPPPPKAGEFWWFFTSCTRLLQREKSKDFRNHVTKYLETLLNSQQQVSSPSPCRGFTSRSSAERDHDPPAAGCTHPRQT